MSNFGDAAATWWNSLAWHAYERAYGDEPGTRARLLAMAPWQTRMIDLGQDEADLWRGVRRSYHAMINRLSREYLAREGPTAGKLRHVLCGPGAGGLIRTAQRVHCLDAGRETRPDATWDLMGDWADDETGLLVMAYDYSDGAVPEMTGWPPCVGYVYFIRWEGWAYYASAASLVLNINIALVWWALLALRERGTRWAELGWQGQGTTEKERNVEFFRRGFGGVDVPASLSAGLGER